MPIGLMVGLVLTVWDSEQKTEGLHREMQDREGEGGGGEKIST